MKRFITISAIVILSCAFNACSETTSDTVSSTTKITSTTNTRSSEIFATTNPDPNVREFNDEEFGMIRLSNLSVPSGVTVYTATYTYSGKVLLTISGGLAIMNDDGTDYHQIWQGSIPWTSGSNGARYLPFQDNERILLGDYILECYPSIDDCQSTELVPIEYPQSITDDPRTYLHYSEVIISPDNLHMAFTIIRTNFWSANAIGELVRESDKYVLNNVKIISALDYFIEDPDNEGYLLVNKLYGGEVKEFINGGSGISTAGAYDFGTARPMFQSLVTAEIKPLSFALGYEETGMVSPDGTSAIIMSTRSSDSSNFAFLDLMPCPNSIYLTMDIMLYIYQYSVSKVALL